LSERKFRCRIRIQRSSHFNLPVKRWHPIDEYLALAKGRRLTNPCPDWEQLVLSEARAVLNDSENRFIQLAGLI
jgi:hypothetical protein